MAAQDGSAETQLDRIERKLDWLIEALGSDQDEIVEVVSLDGKTRSAERDTDTPL